MKTSIDREKRVDEEGLNKEWEQNVNGRAPTETLVNGNKKSVVAPHRKKTLFDRKNQAFSKISKGMEDLAGAQIKRTKLMIETGKNRDGLFLKHKADEAQQTREYKAEEASKNREHELSLAQMYASVRPTSYLSQGDQWHLSTYRPYMQNLSGNSKNIQTNESGQCEYLSHNQNQLRPSTYGGAPQN